MADLTIQTDARPISPEALARLLSDYRPMRPDPPVRDPERIVQAIRGMWKPFEITRRGR